MEFQCACLMTPPPNFREVRFSLEVKPGRRRENALEVGLYHFLWIPFFLLWDSVQCKSLTMMGKISLELVPVSAGRGSQLSRMTECDIWTLLLCWAPSGSLLFSFPLGWIPWVICSWPGWLIGCWSWGWLWLSTKRSKLTKHQASPKCKLSIFALFWEN